MKKRFISIIVYINILLTIYAQEFSPFSFSSMNQVYDYNTGLNYELIDSYRNLVNRTLIKKVIIRVTKTDDKQYYEQEYENGLEVFEVSRVHDITKTKYFYDEQNRLTFIGDDFRYNYISETKREIYYQAILQEKTEIIKKDDYIKIIHQNYTRKISTNEIIKDGIREEEFFYNDNKLTKYVEKSWNRNGVQSKYEKELLFYYNSNGQLEKIIDGYGEKDIRYITEIKYENNYMIQIDRIDLRENTSTKVLFLDYDQYGNWTKSEQYFDDKLEETVTREIIYN